MSTGIDVSDRLRAHVAVIDDNLSDNPNLLLKARRDLMEEAASKLEDLEGECLGLEVERDELRALLRDYEAATLQRDESADARRETFTIPDFLPQELTF